MSPRILTIALLVLCAVLPGLTVVTAAPDVPTADERVLVLVSATDAGALARFAATGLPAYVHFVAADGAYLLAAAEAGNLTALAAAGLDAQVLPAKASQGPFYLAYPPPGRGQGIEWSRFGHLLYADDRAAILAATAEQMSALTATGVEVVRVSFTPLMLALAAATTFPEVTAPDPVVQEMITAVDTGTLRQYTAELSGEQWVTVGVTLTQILSRNTLRGTRIWQATDYVAEHLAARGLDVEKHPWEVGRAPNVIGEKRGETRPDEIYMVTAHLDDMPESVTAPGADDNASGTAAVLAAADILSRYRWDCTLRFALWTGEEQGLLGSESYAHRAYDRDETIAAVLNLDMIAWNAENTAPDMELHARSTMPSTVDLARQFASVIDIYDLDLAPDVIINGIGYSDHASFWKYGYNAILGIEDYSSDFNPDYHTSNDRLARLDMAYYTEFVKATVAAAAHMTGCVIKTPTAPTVSATLEPSALDPDAVAVTLTWQHVVPNTAYEVHRAPAPYFTASAATRRSTLKTPFSLPLRYRDDAGAAGNEKVNDYYLVSGMNEAGQSADSRQVGEFNFALVRGQ